MASTSETEASECKNQADAVYYQQSGASGYNTDEALDTLVTLNERG